MALVLSDAREVRELQDVLNEALTLRLFVNDVTPTGDSTSASFTECSATGYAAEALTYGDWTIAEVSNTARATYPAVTFTMPTLASGLTIYGYYITDATGLAWAERIDTPLEFSAGNTAEVTVNLVRTHATA